MNLKNIITFVKAGYTPAEIAGIDNADAVAALLNEGTKKEDIPAFLDLLKDDPASDPEPEPEKKVKPSKEDPEPEDPTDYKEKYEALKKQMQQKEVRQNMKPDEPSSDEILAEIVRSFM